MPSLRRLGAIAVALLLLAPATAGAATLTYTGTIAPSDPTTNVRPLSLPPSTCSSVAPLALQPPTSYDAYAFRNTGADDCITVASRAPVCNSDFDTLTATTYLGTFAPKDAATGIIGGGNQASCGGNQVESHQAGIPAGRTFVVVERANQQVMQSTGYTLDVTGASLALANAVNVRNGGLPSGNTLNLNASSLKDGTAPEGTVSVSSASGQSYSGPVACLRVSGDRASLLMQVTGGNAPSKFTWAVFWLEENPAGNGGQRNSLLTEAQMISRYGRVCPDPNAPIGGTFNPMTAGYASVIDTPPALVGIPDDDI